MTNCTLHIRRCACRREPALLSAGDTPELSAEESAPDVLPAGLVDDGELIILLIRPSLWYVPLASLGSLLIIALITLALMYLAQFFAWTESQAVGLGVIMVIIRLSWQAMEWWSSLYVLTDRRIVRCKGVFRSIVFNVMLRELKHTSVFQLKRERAAGLGSIGFATKGSDVFDAFWEMIRQPFEVHKTILETIERYGRR